MGISLSVEKNRIVVSVDSNVERKDFDELFEKLKSVKDTNIFIDLRSLLYIRSEILAQLIAIKRVADQKKILLTLLNVSNSVFHVLEISNLTQVFTIEQDYGRYDIKELIELFQDLEQADAVSEYIAANYNDEYRDALLVAMNSDDPLLSEYALLTLGRARDESTVVEIRKKLDSAYPNVVNAAILVLGWLFDSESKERFYEFISSADEQVSDAAGASIALLGDETDAIRLSKLIGGNPQQRKIIAGALALINGDAAYNILAGMLANEEDDSVRTVLIRKIAYFNRDDAIEVLINTLNDPSRAVQEAAAAGLEKTGLKGREAQVIKFINEEDTWISYFAVKALGKQCSVESAEYLKSLYSRLQGKVRLAAVEALGASDADVDDFLNERLKDSNEDIRKEALSAIYLKNKPEGLNRALTLVKNDPSWLVRFRAVEIIAAEQCWNCKEVLLEVKNQETNKYVQNKIVQLLGR